MDDKTHDFWVKNVSLQEVIDSIDEIVAIVDEHKIVRIINKRARETLLELAGLKPEDILGYSVDEVLAPFIDDGITVVGMAVDTRKPLQKNIRYAIKEEGLDKTILYSAIPITEENGMRYVVATGRDMTKLIQLEERLVTSEKLNRYYSSMVHDPADCAPHTSIIFSSKVMEEVLKLALRAAGSDASVFITGESGVGKEEIAKFIQRNSDRNDKPYIAINCSAMPRELLESELFGYADGAFTGSRRGGKKGLLEDADGGTLFLDEIGELPLELQSKFLRAVQGDTFRRVGGNKDISVDVRFISATNITHEQLLDGKCFRQDLLYRLSVIPIYVPALRDRREDIIPLTEYFLNLYNSKYNRRVQLTAAAYSHLCELPWRGNVRQLKNVIERIVILADEGTLLNEELLHILRLDLDMEEVPAQKQDVTVHRLTGLTQAVAETERQLIRMALDEYETVPKAAKALGVPPSTIYRKLKK